MWRQLSQLWPPLRVRLPFVLMLSSCFCRCFYRCCSCSCSYYWIDGTTRLFTEVKSCCKQHSGGNKNSNNFEHTKTEIKIHQLYKKYLILFLGNSIRESWSYIDSIKIFISGHTKTFQFFQFSYFSMKYLCYWQFTFLCDYWFSLKMLYS